MLRKKKEIYTQDILSYIFFHSFAGLLIKKIHDLELHALHFSKQIVLEWRYSENKVPNMSLVYFLPLVKSEHVDNISVSI
jgi:hypothetical protein